MSGIQWPGRQEWAERRRDHNWFDHIEVSNRLADYATQAEIDGAIAAIGDVWCALGRQMKSASSIEIEEIRYRRAGVSRAFKGERAISQASHSNAAVACRPRFSPHSMPGVRRRSKPRYSARSKQCP